MNDTETKVDLLMSPEQMQGAIEEMAAQIRRIVPEGEEIAFVGIIRRGVPLAQRLRAALKPSSPDQYAIGKIDITLYRDDLSTLGPQPVVRPTELPFALDNHTVILVDDVLYTGRTVRAALDAIVNFGRPKAIRLAVLVDRGHREYPIQADIAGKTIETTLNQIVHVHLHEIDGDERVDLMTR